MAFENLSEKLQGTFKKLRGKGVLTEADINDAMREVKLALLEADVNFKVVKEFVAQVKEKAMGTEVLQSLTPGQQVIKIVNEQLVELMGGTNSKLTYSPSGFTVLMMVGLQGTGKTTTCGKLAKWLKKNGKKPALTDKIKVAYKGMTIDGEEFDSSESVEFPLASMIEGWKIAIPEMTEGSKWEIYIPQELAYGERGSMPAIKPFSALVFEVELFNVVAKK